MRIQRTKAGLHCYRYSGLIDGRSVERRVAVVPLDTDPITIPKSVTDCLTPPELDEVRQVLAEERLLQARLALNALADELAARLPLLDAAVVTGEMFQKLRDASDKFSRALARTGKRRSGEPAITKSGSDTSDDATRHEVDGTKDAPETKK